MVYFPQPYPGEILYSLVARFHDHSIFRSNEMTCKQLLEDRSTCAILTFPRHLENFRKNVTKFLHLSPTEIIDKFTLLPYFKNFFPPEKYSQTINTLLHNEENKRLNLFLASLKRVSPIKPIPEYCPLCFQEDTKSYGEAYWHLEHQLPGMIICLKHNCFLHKPEVSLEKQSPKFFIPACSEFCKNHVLELNKSKELTLIAEKLGYYLKNPKSFQYKNDFYKKAVKAGFIKNDRIKIQKLSHEFEGFFTTDLLLKFLKNDKYRRQNGWLRRFIFNENDILFPLGQVLLEVFFENISKKDIQVHPFGIGPWICHNKAAEHFNKKVVINFKISSNRSPNNSAVGIFSCSCGMIYTKSFTGNKEILIKKNFGKIWEQKLIELIEKKESKKKIAKVLGVCHHTVVHQTNKLGIENSWAIKKRKPQKIVPKISNGEDERYRKIVNLKKKWILLLKENENLSISKIKNKSFKAEFSFLYIYAKSWLNHVNSEHRQRKKTSKEILWRERDKLLHSVLKMEHQQLPLSRLWRRVSKSFLISLVAIKYPFFHYSQLSLLPRTSSLLSEIMEDYFAYYKRRVKMAIEELLEEKKPVSNSAVGRKTTLYYPLHKEIKEMIENY